MNKYPGPRCRDGNLLTDTRFSKTECETSNDSRMNQVLMTNEHGDVFKRQINFDECESENNQYTDTESVPSSPNESEYFYEQYIDYPLNDTVLEAAAGDTVYDKRLPSTVSDQSPFSRNISVISNDTLLNYDKHKLQQMQNENNHNSGSRFTFFGVPLPSLGSIWSNDQNIKKSTSRADNPSNGKSRLRNFRLRPGEIVDNFQYSNNQNGVRRPPTASKKPLRNDAPSNIQPPPLPPKNEYPNYQNPYSVPAIERGGFVPMVPNRKGFQPIPDLFANETDAPDDIQETVSTELRPNINIAFDEPLNDELDNRYSILVPTVSPNSTNASHHLNISSLNADDIVLPTKSLNGISLFRTAAVTTNEPLPSNSSSQTNQIPAGLATTKTPSGTSKSFDRGDHDKNYVQKINDRPVTIIRTTTTMPELSSSSTPFYPTFLPNTSDVINLSKNRSLNGNATAKNALSALVAPGAQQNVFRAGSPLGRSKITKIVNSTRSNSFVTPTAYPSLATTLKSPSVVTTTQKLPAAEEYLRTTSHDEYSHELSSTAASHIKSRPPLNDRTFQSKFVDMDWYYNNYNKSTWKEPQLDPGLYRFRSCGNTRFPSIDTKIHFTITILTLVFCRINSHIV